jgi:hypothetical protein
MGPSSALDDFSTSAAGAVRKGRPTY